MAFEERLFRKVYVARIVHEAMSYAKHVCWVCSAWKYCASVPNFTISRRGAIPLLPKVGVWKRKPPRKSFGRAFQYFPLVIGLGPNYMYFHSCGCTCSINFLNSENWLAVSGRSPIWNESHKTMSSHVWFSFSLLPIASQICEIFNNARPSYTDILYIF